MNMVALAIEGMMTRQIMEGIDNVESYIVTVNYDMPETAAINATGIRCVDEEIWGRGLCEDMSHHVVNKGRGVKIINRLYCDDCSTNRHPIKDVIQNRGKANVEIRLLSSAGYGLEGIRRRIGMLNHRPATYFELLALGAEYPRLQYKYEIIAVGSISDAWYCKAWRKQRVPCLRSHNKGVYRFPGSIRCLDLAWLDIESTTRFAAVPLQ